MINTNILTVNQGVSGSSPEGGAKASHIGWLSSFMFYLYILYSSTADKFYIGHSEDPWDRLVHHNTDDKTTYTAKHRPWVLTAVFQAGKTRAEALSIERFIKKQKSRILIEQLVQPDFTPSGRLAQLVRVPHVRD